MTSIHHVVANEELRFFYDAYNQNRPKISETEKKIIELVKLALKEKGDIDLIGPDWITFRNLKLKVLGPSSMARTFNETMGLREAGHALDTTQVKFDQNSLRFLLSPFVNQSPEKIKQLFLSLRRDEQKLILKAFSHFSVTNTPLVLSKKEGYVLYPIAKKLLKGERVQEPPETQTKQLAFALFAHLYPIYKGVESSPLERAVMEIVEDRLQNKLATLPAVQKVLTSDNFEVERASLSQMMARIHYASKEALSDWYNSHVISEDTYEGVTFPGAKSVSPFDKGHIVDQGERQIVADFEADYAQILRGYEKLKDSGAKSQKDLEIVREKIRVARVKIDTALNLYHPLIRDREFSFLYGKALLDLQKLMILENGVERDLGIFNTELTEQIASLSPRIEFFLERASLMGHQDAAPLLAAALREGDWSNPNETFIKASSHLQRAVESGNSDGILEMAKLHTVAWRERVEKVDEDSALIFLKSIGSSSADALYFHYKEGSPKAGDLLVRMIRERTLGTRTLKESFISVLSFFFGRMRLFGETQGTFFSKNSKQVSENEVDFLISASLTGVKEARETLQRLVDRDFGPKHRLREAMFFLDSVEKARENDPYLSINGKEAYQHLQQAALLSLKQENSSKQFNALLESYLKNIDANSQPYHLLKDLQNQLK